MHEEIQESKDRELVSNSMQVRYTSESHWGIIIAGNYRAKATRWHQVRELPMGLCLAPTHHQYNKTHNITSTCITYGPVPSISQLNRRVSVLPVEVCQQNNFPLEASKLSRTPTLSLPPVVGCPYSLDLRWRSCRIRFFLYACCLSVIRETLYKLYSSIR